MMNGKKISPGMMQYMDIKKEYPEYLLFYRMGDFYEMFYDDAIEAARVLGITLTKRGKAEGMNIPMCGVPFHSYETYLERLIKAGYKVAICEQMENPEEAKKRGSKSVVKRDVVRLVTSGTLLEENLLDARSNNYLLAVAGSDGHYGLSWLDLSTGAFYTEEIKSDSKNEAQELNSVLSRLSPGEILLADALLQKPNLFSVLQEYKDKLSPLPRARFNLTNAHKRVLDYFQVQTLDSFGSFSPIEITAAGVVLDYVEITQKGKMPRIRRPIQIVYAQYMEIDAATRRSLELVESHNGNALISVIDRTVTGCGARMLKSRLMLPLTDVKEINRRLDAVEFFTVHHDTRQKSIEVLRSFPDVEHSISRLSTRKGGPKDLLAILQALAMLPRVKVILESYKPADVVDELPISISQMIKDFGTHYDLVDTLGRALIQDELPTYARDGNFVAPGFSPELDAVREMRDRGHQYIMDLQSEYAEQTQLPQLKIKYNSVIGYFIEVPSKFSKQFLDNPDFIHRQSVLNATRFTTVKLTELENNIRGATDKALALELEIYENLVREVMVSADDIGRASAAVADLDVTCALADLALENNYCRPKLDESLTFKIEEGRHPVVEVALRKNNEGQFVGNNCSLSVENNRIWLITGPNMAGKSTFLRQNALIAVMAQIGSFVPAKSAHIGVINKLFSRVGASDDLSHGRSTFMVEMVETASILNRADEHSFVILDEIGRGTATFDGMSIAWATVEYLYEVNRCRALFATHYHELSDLSNRMPALSLHCMKIKEFKDQVIFLHEVIDGAADRSYGIHVAKLAGLPATVINRSQDILKRLETGEQKKNLRDISADLPLFAQIFKEKEQVHISPLEEALKHINPDDLTAREALDKLYQLKELLEEK